MSWWQRGVIYHVYPRSFADADGDGVGDLRGIAERLDHLRRLGVDAVWLSPIYRSPMKDFGYDITDHTAIDPRFGTLDDFDALVAAAHDRGLRVLLDFVPNHTSDEHPWFREHPDWYLWRDRPDGGRPTTGSACSADRRGRSTPSAASTTRTPTCASSPTSNWRNPELREAMLGVLRFWLDRGVDGFRVDALRQVLKDPELARQPAEPRVPRRPAGVRLAAARPQRRPRRPRAGGRDRGGDRRARRRDGRRALPPVRAARPLLRRRGAPALEHAPDLGAVGAARAGGSGRALRGRAARRARGRTGCSATTTAAASRPASGPRRRAWRRCCC